jgi:hypothetical protein
MRDLLGNEVSIEQARAMKGRKTPVPAGYAALPGTGPEGETCGSCRHLYRRQYAKTYLKCGLMQPYWTGGHGSDIRAKAPACRRWEAGDAG